MSRNNKNSGDGVITRSSTSSEDGNEAYDARLIGNRVELLSMNRQQQIPANTERYASSSSSMRHLIAMGDHEFLSATPHGDDDGNSTDRGRPFINGDLIDLCDSVAGERREHLSVGSSRGSDGNLVEAINSQLLADINGKSQTIRDCYVLYPTKVSFDNTISGTKLNHITTKKLLNNSVDLSSAARSSETIGNRSESTATAATAAAAATNEQHQTVIREFKRLGTYCTLRPEQRRKHLLKVLPTLRNSMLLQTLLGSHSSNGIKNWTAKMSAGNAADATTVATATSSSSVDELLTTNNDIDSLLIDLDDFIIDGNTALMQRHRNNEQFASSSESIALNYDSQSQRSLKSDATTSNASSSYSVANSSEITGSCIKIDPDKVEDCLLELDAYLEEIDRDYVLACAAHGPSTSSVASTSTMSVSSQSLANAMLSSSSSSLPTTKISASLGNDCSEKTSKNHIDRLLNVDNLLNCNGGSVGLSAQQSNQQLIDSRSINTMDNTRPRRRQQQQQQRRSTTTICDGASNFQPPISNSDIQINQCSAQSNDASSKINGSRIADNKRKSNDIANDQALKRGHKLRNTVAVSGLNNQAMRLNGVAVSGNASTTDADPATFQSGKFVNDLVWCFIFCFVSWTCANPCNRHLRRCIEEMFDR